MLKKIPKFLSGHRKGPRPSTNTTSMYQKRTTHVNRTHSRIYRFIYIDYCRLLLCTQLILMGHTHTDIALYIYRFMQRYTVLLYTSCTDGLYLCVHNCTLLCILTLPKHTIMVHTLCSDQLYYCTFILLSILCTLWDYCVHNCIVQLYTRQCQPGLCFVNQSQKSFDLPASL